MSTVAELRKVASDLEIAGRSKMNKADLEAAITEALNILHDEANVEYDHRNEYAMLEAAEPAGEDVPVPVDMRKVVAELIATPRISGQPLSATVRAAHYKRQNGANKLTAKQARRLAKKIFRNRNCQLANV